MNERYEARTPEQVNGPCFVYDRLLAKNSSSHITFESAAARAYTLNRFGNGLDRRIA
jgi:hypothetical protein